MASRWAGRLLLLVAAGPLVACYTGIPAADSLEAGGTSGEAAGGESGDGGSSSGGDDVPPEVACGALERHGIRRISSSQYHQILRDTLPAPLVAVAVDESDFPTTEVDDGFSTFVAANLVSTDKVRRIEDNATRIADAFFENRQSWAPLLMPCLSADYTDADVDGCTPEFVESFGRRVFRRELTNEERTRTQDLYDAVRAEHGSERALAALLEYFLQAPALLYVTEPGADGAGELRRLPPEQVAVRLGLLFLNSTPDDELREAAEDGRLDTRAGVEEQARRLATGPEATRLYTQFHAEWTGAFSLGDTHRDHALWDEDVHTALEDEVGAFAEWFIAQTDASFTTLLTTPDFPTDERLGAVYGVGEASPRSGLLTTASVMAASAHESKTSLVERGVFVLNHVLCQSTPPFPDGLDTQTALDATGHLPTQRERLEPLLTDPSCASCHVAINPMGFPFERYDWIGAYRETENGAPIDASASVDVGVLAGEYADASQLLEAIAQTEVARSCYVRHVYRYFAGRRETDRDACVLEELESAFAQSSGSVPELMVALATSDAFLFRQMDAGEDE
ncbi:MAG: DUF1588 domain-containing protein [Nannocystales bacterium]